MWDGLKRILDWIRRLLGGLPTSAVRRALQELAQERVALASAQHNFDLVTAKLKTLNAQKEPDPAELARLEGDAAAFARRIDQTQRRIGRLERRLDELDPDGSIRRSMP